MFVGTQSGTVYALSAATGCVHWIFQAEAAVRAAISIGRIEDRGNASRHSSAIAPHVYALDAPPAR